MQCVYRLQDNATNLFWNGNIRYPLFEKKGNSWNSQTKLENSISQFISYSQNYNNNPNPFSKTWEIVEFKITETASRSFSISDFLFHQMMNTELHKINWRFAQFYDVIRKRGDVDKIEFIFKLKPEDGNRYVTRERILKCRSQLRLLDVKTRTYREYNGMFGMMNREQAMRARLTLDIDEHIDLTPIREKVRTLIA